MTDKRITIVCGHYGSGKTNLSVNLAVNMAAQGVKTAIADLDIVNPYFRTADFGKLFAELGIELIAPMYANSNLDLPVLPPRLASAIGEGNTQLIIDVGGDDDGAVALGGYAHRLEQEGYEMLYVINRSRYLADDIGEEIRLLRGIEQCSRLAVTGLVNNTNLGSETTAELIRASCGYLDEIAAQTGLPIVTTTAPRILAGETRDIDKLLLIDIYVKTPW